MSDESFKRIMSGLDEVLRHAKDEEVPGMVIHNVQIEPKPRGFAALDPEQRKLVAASGGRAVPAHKRAFALDSDLASRAGAAGGSKGRGGGRPRKNPEDEG